MYLFLVLHRSETMEDKPGPSKPIICGQNKLTENYFRLCGLITTLCSEIFRITLSSCIKPDRLRSELDSNRTKLEKIMNVSQREQIYKTPGNALSTKDFDISLLYILLRNICRIPKHTKGWGHPPEKGDNSLAACIERIRIQRNLISAHSPNGKIEDVEFQKKWDELRNDITQIERHVTGGEGFKDSVDDLYKCKLSHDDEKQYEHDFKKSDGKYVSTIKRPDYI